MVAAWYARLKKEGTVGTHFVKIKYQSRFPSLYFFYSSTAFGMLHCQPIPVQVRPIVIGPASRPCFIELSVLGITVHMIAFVGIDPRSKAINPIGVNRRIKKNDYICQILRYFIGSSKMVSR